MHVNVCAHEGHMSNTRFHAPIQALVDLPKSAGKVRLKTGERAEATSGQSEREVHPCGVTACLNVGSTRT